MTADNTIPSPEAPELKEVALLDRDASILDFNLRVLDWAKRNEVPLLERLRYLCIVSSNLDEFFEVRAMLHLDAFHNKDHSGLYTSQTFKSNYQKAADLVAEEGNPELKLRVFVQGGGCSGFQYGFTFDEVVNEDDTEMKKNGVTLLIDAMSMQYLVGAEIDYKEDLQGAQFVIKNPNATTTCGCGSSFSA